MRCTGWTTPPTTGRVTTGGLTSGRFKAGRFKAGGLKAGGLVGAAVGLVVAAVCWPSTQVRAQAAPRAEERPDSAEFYNSKVQPILQANCYRCHGGLNHRGGLNIETYAGMMKGGHDGSVLVPGHPEQSLLIKLIRHEGPPDDPMPMPPKGKLSDADIAVVTAWVQAGAKMP